MTIFYSGDKKDNMFLHKRIRSMHDSIYGWDKKSMRFYIIASIHEKEIPYVQLIILIYHRDIYDGKYYGKLNF